MKQPTIKKMISTKKIIRVFPKRTSFTPLDDDCFFDSPGAIIPEHDEIHVCAVFTWGIARAVELRDEWQEWTNKPVLLGGPALGDCGGDFVPGLYVKQGVTFTSRGCPNNCSFCFVPQREGKLREIPIQPGHIMQANNFLAESKPHRREAYDMLRQQRHIEFRGGLETTRLTDWDIEEMRNLHIYELWLACDTKGALPNFKKACERLKKAGFKQNKIRCYVLIGDDMQENLTRLIQVYEAGALPFAQLVQPAERIEYSQEWKQFARTWSRPAATRTFMKEYLLKR
jgi:hypothetical protein